MATHLYGHPSAELVYQPGGDQLRKKKLALALWLAGALLIATAGIPRADEAAPIAQIKKITGQVAILRSGDRTPANLGDPLFVKDVIETGPDGAIGVTFVDNTVFSAGPDSQLALDEFQFDSNDFQGSMLADMRRGTLAVVTGDITRSSPGAMKIRTPTAVLGVRGTTFAVQVYGDH
ncbi:MAG: FecR domain-containing protein [Stellaceae bacterium]